MVQELTGGAPQSAESCAAGDFDADGDTDLLVATPAYELHVNDGSGRLDAATPLNGTANAPYLESGDINQGGRPDLLTGETIQVNPGPGSDWRAHTYWRVERENRFLPPVDLTGDGHPEIVLRRSHDVVVMEYVGAASMWTRTGAIHNALRGPVRIAFGDLNGDGLADALASEPGQPELILHLHVPPCR